MSGVLIYSKDRANYESVMNQCCGGPRIIEDLGDTLRVDFCSAAMSMWVQAGFWYSF